ncbi:MAG: extracellular solute-binding protein, partial [Clostridiales bacterium]|nr:extracellular solute-binding protein [Clostridiales bacterium]
MIFRFNVIQFLLMRNNAKKTRPKIHITAAAILSLLLLLSFSSCGGLVPDGKAETERITVRLAAPQNPNIQDFDTNLYKLWLEEQTGLNLEMTWLPSEDAEKIVRQQLDSGADLPDAYIGFGDYALFKNPSIQTYAERGRVIALNDYIEKYGTYTKGVFEELPEHNIKSYMTSADGNIYFMPGFSSSVITRYRQLMWVNKDWLSELNLKTPTTTEEFRDMLLAFQERYPDKIPMAGTEGHYSKNPYDFLFNAFIYNDINNSRIVLEDGIVGFAPIRDEWREALKYMRGLYDEGLYSPLSFTQDNQQMNQMANDANDILGAFLSPGITYTVQQNSPEIMERYIGIGPLEGPEEVKLTTVFVPIPKSSGIITSACEHPEEVFKLFDLMLSEEACLMGRYGTKGEDWDFAEEGISIYGTPATINIIN